MEPKRIPSIIVLIIFFALLCFLCWLDMLLAVNLPAALDNPKMPESTGDGTADIVVTGLVALSLGMGFIFVLAISAFIIVTALVCLGFSIRNTKAENKPVKVINIFLSCCFAAAAALGIISIILLRVL